METENTNISTQLFKDYIDADNQVKALEDELKDAKALRFELKRKVIATLQDNDVKKISVAGKNFSWYPMLVASIENQDEFFNYLRSTNSANIIKESIHSKTLNAFVKERVEEGEPEPPGLKVNYIDELRMSKI